MSDDFHCVEAISGRTEVEVVLETDDVLAFHHTRPFWPVHIVVVPKRHVPSLTDLGGRIVESRVAPVRAIMRNPPIAAVEEVSWGGQ